MSNDPLQPPPAFQTTATLKPRKSRKLLWILLLIPASVIGLLVMFIGAGALFVVLLAVRLTCFSLPAGRTMPLHWPV